MLVQIAFVGRDYERAADHAVTIARWVDFMVTGRLPGENGEEPHVA
jgi:phosphate uptake regulator